MAAELTFCKVTVSDVLEKNATAEERAAQIDIADWLVGQMRVETSPPTPLHGGEGGASWTLSERQLDSF